MTALLNYAADPKIPHIPKRICELSRPLFRQMFSIKIKYWDEFWHADKMGKMAQIHINLVNNLENFVLKLVKNPKNTELKKSVALLVAAGLATFLNYQQALRNKLDTEKIRIERETQAKIMDLVLQALEIQNVFEDDDDNDDVLFRFFYKDIEPNGNNDGILKIIR